MWEGGADAVLVGEALAKTADPRSLLAELNGISSPISRNIHVART
jgi:hypothetical protein